MKKIPHLKAVAALALLVAIVYGRTLANGFVSYDDPMYAFENPMITSGLSSEGLRYAFGFTRSFYWHPLPILSHMLDNDLFGPRPGLQHMMSALIHLLSTLMLYFALVRLTGGFKGRSLLVAALFAAHPLNVESVAWIAERKSLLSTLFFIAALFFHAAYARRPSFAKYAAVFASMLLGLLSKPAVMTLPAALLLLDYWPLGRFPKGPPPASGEPARPRSLLWLAAEKLPLLGLTACSMAMTVLSTRKTVFGLSVAPEGLLSLRIQNMLVSYAQYIEKAFWPEKLAFFYPFPSHIPTGRTAACAALLGVLALACWMERRKRPYLLVGYLWFLGTLVPMAGLIQTGMWPSMADRFAYIPLVGLFTAVVWLGADLAGSGGGVPKTAKFAAALIVSAYAAAAFVQTGYWKDSKRLYTHALDATGDNFLAHSNLGVVYLQENDPEKGLFHSNRAFLLNPSLDEPAINTGNAWNKLRNTENALFWYKRALSINPGRIQAYINIAATLLPLGRYDEAEKALSDALKIAPGDPQVNYAMGLVKKAKEGKAEAERYNSCQNSAPVA